MSGPPSNHKLPAPSRTSTPSDEEKHDTRPNLSPYPNLSRSSSTLTHHPTPRANEDGLPQSAYTREGRDRRTLSEEGYRALAILATFLAGMQAQVLSSVLADESLSSQIITTLFISGLLADLFGAILSFESARWFEMLTEEETRYLQQCWADAQTGKTPANNPALMERWIALSAKMGPYAVISGLIFLVSGLLVFVWAQQPLPVAGVATAVCCVFAAFVPPFAFKHNRLVVLNHLRLARRSG